MKRIAILLILSIMLLTATPVGAEITICAGCQSQACGINPDLCVENACPCDAGQPCVCPQEAGDDARLGASVSNEDEDAVYATQGAGEPGDGLEEPALIVGDPAEPETEEAAGGGIASGWYALIGLAVLALVGRALLLKRSKSGS
jgi:hypothetical protein